MRPIPVTDAIHDYIDGHSGRVVGEPGRDQGTFLTLLAQLMNARHAIEIGTATGYSAQCIVRGLPADGHLVTCDITGARPAIETLRALSPEPAYDLAFIGADKPGYLDYYEELVPRVRAGGAILVDHVLLADTVVTDPDDEGARTMREFNAHVCADKRVDAVMLSIGDGMTLARKLPSRRGPNLPLDPERR